MKCVLLGDPLVPSKYMAGILSQLESRDVELLQLDWKSDLTLADFVKVTRQMELTGPIDLPPQLLSTLTQADIVVTNHAPLSSLAIKSSSKLKLIASTRSGTENIDLVAAREKGITVVNSPGRNATAVADYTIGLIIALSRHIASAHCKMMQGIWEEKWSRPENLSFDLAHKTIGIIGYGKVGREVGVRSRSFGMKIIVCDPYLGAGLIGEGVNVVDLETLLRESDIVTIHARLTKETRNLIGEREFSLMKPSAIVINTARAEIIDESALLRSLKAGRIRGAALDVFRDEPITPNNELTKLENVLLTPHLAGSTLEAELENGVKMVGEEIIEFLEGRAQCNVVR